MEKNMIRRQLLVRLSQLIGISFLSSAPVRSQEKEVPKKLNIMMKSAWGSDDPTRASFPFLHGLALAEAGHNVQIFLTGEATYLMRKPTANAIMPVGWPPLSQTLEKVVAKHIPIFA
jgi:predicted peroxiredoxin